MHQTNIKDDHANCLIDSDELVVDCHVCCQWCLIRLQVTGNAGGFIEYVQQFGAQVFHRYVQNLVDYLAVIGTEFVAVIQIDEGVRLTTQGMLDALKPSPIQGDRCAIISCRFYSLGPSFTGLSQLV